MENRALEPRFEPQILDLIPHREPMLLINKVLDVDKSNAFTLVFIDEQASFFQTGKGVPAWIGIEYMGQTAALIAGYRLKKGLLPPHLGFLLGTRSFKAECDYFSPGTTLKITSKEHAVVAEGFAKFDCTIEEYNTDKREAAPLATASLSVFRRLLNEGNVNE